MKNIQKFVTLFVLALLTAVGATPQRAGATTLTYDVTLDSGLTDGYPVESILFYSIYPSSETLTPYPSSLSAPGGKLTQTVDKGVTAVFVLGILEVGVAEVPHLVLFMNKAVNAKQDFTALFPNATESDLIAAVANLSPGPGGFPDAIAVLAFGNDAKAAGIQFSPDGGTFNVVEFSTGVVIGSGTAALPSAPTGVPLPGTLALLGFGLIAFAGARRRSA